MKNKKICFLVPHISIPGGVEKILSEFSTQLVMIGYDVTIIVLDGCREPYYFIDKRVKIRTINHKKNRILLLASFCLFLNKELKNNLFDVVITIQPIMAFLFFISGGSSFKHIVWEHTAFDAPNKKWKILRYPIYKKAKKIVCLSQDDIHKFKSLNNSSYIINNFIPIEFTKKEIVKKRYDILFVGRLVKYKGVDILLHALYHLKLNGRGFKVAIVGDGPEFEALKQLSKKYKLEDIDFLGNQLNTIEYYRCSKLFVLPSYIEGFPTVLLEAISQGIPVISSNCKTGPSDIVEPDYNGYLFEPGDYIECSKSILAALYSEDKYNQLSHNAYLSSQRFSINEFVNKWEVIIDEF